MIFAILAGVLASPAAVDEIFSLKGGYSKLKASGDVDDEDGFFAEATLQFGNFRFFASYLPTIFSGSAVLSRDIDFDGETFFEGGRVESDVDIDIYEAGWAWLLINLDDLPLWI